MIVPGLRIEDPWTAQTVTRTDETPRKLHSFRNRQTFCKSTCSGSAYSLVLER
jgi:hypothetical protein